MPGIIPMVEIDNLRGLKANNSGLKGHSIDSISFMGMGEALANVQVFDALHVLTNPELFANLYIR
jgi:adenine C2-methylase RlmN of 23S rRNA A2503 and tRNA A37